MYCQSESLRTVQSILDESPHDQGNLFPELGFAIVKNNLAIRYPGFPPAVLKSQYEQMLGISLKDRHELNLKSIADPCSFDLLGRLNEEIVHADGSRKKSGEFYTPTFVVDYMVDLLELDTDARLAERKFIDIACGSGAFLTAGMKKVIRMLKRQGIAGDDLLQIVADHVYGMDISPVAVDICKINLYLVLLDELGPETLARAGKIRLNVFATNAIDNQSRDIVEAGTIDYVLGNPPYLEAKKMPAELKQACRESWPELKGAFDLYVPFILQCNRLVAKNGKVCLILPDKFTVAQYGIGIRDKLLSDFSISELVDLSGMDVFHKATVYPAVIAYQNIPPSARHRVRTRMSIMTPAELTGKKGYGMVPQDIYRTIGHNKTLFCLPEEGDMAGMLRRFFADGTPISDYIDFRSAVSFHKKGLRELFVRQSFNGEAGPVLKYLGGRSYAKKNEVGLFRLGWDGYYINYDQARLKEYNNALPPLSNFMQEKIILCQHAPRITAAYDGKGEYVTKDVYPIGIAAPGLESSPLSLKYFTVLLNSELMSFVYGTVYKGIQIGGGYYHYLPTWIDILPVIVPKRKDILAIERLADELASAEDQAARLRSMRRADDIVYRIYGVTEEQRPIIHGAVPPWNLTGD
ncbi:MAG TPA: N-6 DNA methylase [Methanocella sp.]|jgi:hypothetical protein